MSAKRAADTQPVGAGWRYAGLVAAVAALALVGYLGYESYPRMDLPAGEGAGLAVLAAGAGLAAFFSPCSFPLLVTALARPVGDVTGGTRRRVLRATAFAAALAVGASLFLVLAGAALAIGGGALFGGVTFTSTAGRIIRTVVGLLLVTFGLIQLGVVRTSLRWFEPASHRLLARQARLRRQRPMLGFALFGFGYLVAGFG